MTETTAIHAGIAAFSAAYDYDASYLAELATASPGAYAAFAGAQAMSSYRAALPLEAHHVARITTMQAEDCGACAQLNLRMAVEDSVDRELLAVLLRAPDELPAELRDVRDHARAVVENAVPDPERAGRIRAHYGDEAFAELAVVITGCRIYPTAKRALLRAGHCEILTLDF